MTHMMTYLLQSMTLLGECSGSNVIISTRTSVVLEENIEFSQANGDGGGTRRAERQSPEPQGERAEQQGSNHQLPRYYQARVRDCSW